jgi:GT2 family glycosyltransferase
MNDVAAVRPRTRCAYVGAFIGDSVGDPLSGSDCAPRISVAVSTYRRPDGLARLLEALRPQIEGRPARELVVINDGSHDAKYEAAIKPFAGLVSYHPLPQNVGIARARNESAARAHGDYIVFTDDDCVPPPFWLDWLEARLDANPEIDVLIGTTRPNLPERPRFFERVNGHYDLIPQPLGEASVPLFVTANVAIRRALFERLGGFGFGPEFPGAGEDTELASRLAAAGSRTVVDRNWYVRHDVSDGLVRQMRRYWRYGYSNVWMCRLTTAPPHHMKMAIARRAGHVAHGLGLMKENLEMSVGFSTWTLLRWYSAAAASLVLMAYYDGCAAAAAERRRELRI